MESSVAMPFVSPPQNKLILRRGQRDLSEYLPLITTGHVFTATWPPGYGKSLGFAMTWEHCNRIGLANRLLMVVANDTQRTQILNDFASDCRQVSAPCPDGIWVFERSAGDIHQAMKGRVLVFVTSAHQLGACYRGGVNLLKDLLTLAGTKWLIGFDEFHHYGDEMSWGEAAKAAISLGSVVVAMSATPYRRGNSHIFPDPVLTVTYSQAVEEKAVKPMLCHSYDYKVSFLQDSVETTYTTSQLIAEAPDGIDKWEERRAIRYCPDYIEPLILNPIHRLTAKRAETGKRLQLLIRAMSCAHAKMICQQVKECQLGDLTVDWIGTGPHGRSDDDNDRIRRSFCPAKVMGARPEPDLDILVQVSMAGEGFDSINVAEIVDLFPVSDRATFGCAVQDKQFYGRGSRVVPGHPDITLHVSVPTDHPLAPLAGSDLHSWMDSCGDHAIPGPGPGPDKGPDIWAIPDLPPDRAVELLNITTETDHFRAFVGAVTASFVDFDINNPENMTKVCAWYQAAYRHEQDKQSLRIRIFQLRECLTAAVGTYARAMVDSLGSSRYRVKAALIGKYCRDMNADLKRIFGKERDCLDEPELKQAHAIVQGRVRALSAQQHIGFDR